MSQHCSCSQEGGAVGGGWRPQTPSVPHGAPLRQPHPGTLRRRPPPRQSASSLCLRAGSGSGIRACAEEPARGVHGWCQNGGARLQLLSHHLQVPGQWRLWARGRRLAGCRASGRRARSLSGAACRRQRSRTEGRFAESSGLRALGDSGGWTWIGVTGVGRAAGIRRPRGTCSCPEAS